MCQLREGPRCASILDRGAEDCEEGLEGHSSDQEALSGNGEGVVGWHFTGGLPG